MSRSSVFKYLLTILVFSICILQSCGNGGSGRSGGSGVWRSSRSGLPERRSSSSRSTGQLRVLGYYVWGSANSAPSKRGHLSSHEYPFGSKERYTPDFSQEDLERMPKNYRRIVESGANLEDFKAYYLSDLYIEDMNQIASEIQSLKH